MLSCLRLKNLRHVYLIITNPNLCYLLLTQRREIIRFEIPDLCFFMSGMKTSVKNNSIGVSSLNNLQSNSQSKFIRKIIGCICK